jgi:undecaprenyl-diphosphatase
MSGADHTVFFWINGLADRVPIIDSFMRLMASDYLIPLLMALILFGLWFIGTDAERRERNQKAVMITFTAVAFASMIVKIINIFYDRLRPFELYPTGEVRLIFYTPTDPSFPSNMAAVAFAFAAGTWLVNRKLGYIFLIPAVLASFARVYVGVHYPLDVTVGAVVGIIATFGAVVVNRLVEPLPTLIIKGARRLYVA